MPDPAPQNVGASCHAVSVSTAIRHNAQFLIISGRFSSAFAITCMAQIRSSTTVELGTILVLRRAIASLDATKFENKEFG
jgi:hypothetical protein